MKNFDSADLLLYLEQERLAQQPKLQSYINQMRENVASDLHTNISNISIKATTEENLGITGKGRGITAASIVLLEEI